MSHGAVDLVSLVIFLVTTILSGVLTWQIRNYAVAHGWATGPQSDRHIHTNPIPRFGGVAIYTTFTVALLALWGARDLLRLDFGNSITHLLPLLPPATMMFLVGLWDDCRGLPASVKLGFQVAAGVWLYEVGHGLQISTVLFGHGITGTLSLIGTVFWVLWITNSFNLIDGLDGLAAGAALFSLVTLFIVGVLHGNSESVMGCTLLAASIFGFLRYNFNPATIFLGDSGSLFLGFMLSAISLGGQQSKVPTLVAISVPMVAFGLPLVETVISIVRRLISGTPIFRPDRSHIHHRLLELGMSHRHAVILLYGVSGFCGLISLFLLYPRLTNFALIISVIGIVFIVGVQKLRYPEFLEIGRLARSTIDQNQVIIKNLQIRSTARLLQRARTANDVEEALHKLFPPIEFLGYEVTIDVPPEGGFGRLHMSFGNWSTVDNVPIWRLEFDLGVQEKMGTLTLFRTYGRRNIMPDANVLVGELVPALSSAVKHICLVNRENLVLQRSASLE